MNQMVANPFGAPAKAPEGGLVAVEQQRAMQEVQASMVIAKKFPRDQIMAMDKILQACTRPMLAENALYSYNRGGSDVTGPSIRLAETAAQNWGNLLFGFREISRGIDGKGIGYSDVEAYAWDLETNVKKPIHFRVNHWRDTKKGGYALKDERDIYELMANMASRRLRNCILAVIPGDVIEAAMKQCEITLNTNADVSPDAVNKLVSAFEPYGVTKKQIEKRIGRRIDSIQPAQVVQMRKIYASIRDGMSSAVEWFEIDEQPSSPQGDILKQAMSSDKPQKKQEAEITDDTQAAKEPSNQFKDAMSAIKAGDIELAQDLMNGLPDDEKLVIGNLINSRKSDDIPV